MGGMTGCEGPAKRIGEVLCHDEGIRSRIALTSVISPCIYRFLCTVFVSWRLLECCNHEIEFEIESHSFDFVSIFCIFRFLCRLPNRHCCNPIPLPKEAVFEEHVLC